MTTEIILLILTILILLHILKKIDALVKKLEECQTNIDSLDTSITDIQEHLGMRKSIGVEDF